MPNVERTPRQTVRVDKDLWDRAGRAVGPRQRGEAIRGFLRWLTHETDELPERPPAAPAPACAGGDGGENDEATAPELERP